MVRGELTTPPQDILRELVFGEPSGPPPIGAVATITTATALVDRMADAVGWGVEIAAAEAARTKWGADADYLARLAPTKDLFVPASGHIAQVTRLG